MFFTFSQYHNFCENPPASAAAASPVPDLSMGGLDPGIAGRILYVMSNPHVGAPTAAARGSGAGLDPADINA